jgi:hypothetical protein
MKKLITIITIIAGSGFAHADGPKPKFKSYVEMQAEREAIADAKYARFRAGQDAVIEQQKQAAEDRIYAREQMRADRARYLQLKNIAAAGASKVDVVVNK